MNAPLESFDYIVVGGGSAGCVMAARLSENTSNQVLLIESGRADKDPFIHIPATFFKVIEKGIDVHLYRGESEASLNGRGAIVPQGHVLGGGSSVNAMIYIRGNAADYDGWAAAGNPAWSYDHVLPVFRDLEGNQRIDDGFHGTGGPLSVSDRTWAHPLSEAFVAAGQQVQLPANDDFNGASQSGVGFYQRTIRKGRRWSAAQAFLRDAEKRPNLTILTGRRVARIVVELGQAKAVALEDGTVYGARSEIIMAAGAIETPRLLQLSGIGDAAALAEFGIESVADLPGVGENYQDHMEVPVQAETRGLGSFMDRDKGLGAALDMIRYSLTRTGILSSNVVECGGFADVSGRGVPDIQFHVLPVVVGFIDREAEQVHGITVNPCHLQPRSRGSVKLASANPRDAARFTSGVLTDEHDVDVLVRGVELALKILEAPALADIIERRLLPVPGAEHDRDALVNHVRDTCKTVFHPSGTCRMGPASERESVVAQDLKVHGIQGLRVCDASVMPSITSGNTNAPVMMIAERCARFVSGRETL